MTDGGPNNGSLFMVYYLFRNAFQYGRMGYACAIAWTLFVIVLVLPSLFSRLRRLGFTTKARGGRVMAVDKEMNTVQKDPAQSFSPKVIWRTFIYTVLILGSAVALFPLSGWCGVLLWRCARYLSCRRSGFQNLCLA